MQIIEYNDNTCEYCDFSTGFPRPFDIPKYKQHMSVNLYNSLEPIIIFEYQDEEGFLDDVRIPIKYCPVCGRLLRNNKDNEEEIQED